MSSSDKFCRRNGVKLVRGEGERALWRCTTIHLALHWVSAQEPAISGQALPSANCATPPSPFTHPTSLPPTIFGANTDTQSMSSDMSLVESPAVADQQSACKKSVSIVSCWYSLALSAVRAVFRPGLPWPSPAPSIPQLHGELLLHGPGFKFPGPTCLACQALPPPT